MNCADITRLVDSRTFGSLTESERRDCEAHARTCHRCAQLWVGHARFAAMSIPPMPAEFAMQCQTLVAARARGNVLRFVPRTLIVVSSFVVLAAAAAVVTMKYVVPALDRAASPAPQSGSVVAVAPVQEVTPPPASPSQIIPVAQPDKPVRPVVQGESDVNKPASIAATIAAMSAAAAAPAPAASNCIFPDNNGVTVIVSQDSVTTMSSVTTMRGGRPYQCTLSGQDIPFLKAAGVFYSRVANAKSADDAMLMMFRTTTHLSPEVIAPYMEYVKAAVAEHGRYQLDQWSRFCGKRAAITTADQLAAMLVQMDADAESNEARYIADSERILGAGNKRLVDDYVLGTRNGLSIQVRDMPKFVKWSIDSGMSVSAITAKLCENQ